MKKVASFVLSVFIFVFTSISSYAGSPYFRVFHQSVPQKSSLSVNVQSTYGFNGSNDTSIGSSASIRVVAYGGTPSYNWSSSNGSPVSVIESSNGYSLVELPLNTSSEGSNSVTVMSTDSSGTVGSVAFSYRVVSDSIVTVSYSKNYNFGNGIDSLNNVGLGSLVYVSFQADGGTNPYDWSVSTGDTIFPSTDANGVSVASVALEPTSTGAKSFTIFATDVNGVKGSYTFNYNVVDQSKLNPRISLLQIQQVSGGVVSTLSSPVFDVASMGQIMFEVENGVGPYVWSMTGGDGDVLYSSSNMPSLSNDISVVLVNTDTPSSKSMTINVVDAKNNKMSYDLKVVVNGQVADFGVEYLVDNLASTGYVVSYSDILSSVFVDVAVKASGGTKPYTEWSMSGDVGNSKLMDYSSYGSSYVGVGVVFLDRSVVGSHTVNFSIKDANGVTKNMDYTYTVVVEPLSLVFQNITDESTYTATYDGSIWDTLPLWSQIGKGTGQFTFHQSSTINSYVLLGKYGGVSPSSVVASGDIGLASPNLVETDGYYYFKIDTTQVGNHTIVFNAEDAMGQKASYTFMYSVVVAE